MQLMTQYDKSRSFYASTSSTQKLRDLCPLVRTFPLVHRSLKAGGSIRILTVLASENDHSNNCLNNPSASIPAAVCEAFLSR